MNEIINKFLLAGDKSMPEMHLKQPGFTYSALGSFTKNKERIEKFMQTRNTDFIYRNELDKACFDHDMAYGKVKNLVTKTQSDKVLREKAFKIASDTKYDGYQRGLASMVYKFFYKKSSRNAIINEANYQLEMNSINELSENVRKEKYINHLETIFEGVDLADMQSFSRYYKGIRYLLCEIDLFSKCEWVIPIKDKKGSSIVNTFKKKI